MSEPESVESAGRAAHHVGPSIDASLVRRLVSSQFAQWADLPVTPVVPGGHDNRTFRLGDDMSVRLPSAAAYAPQVKKEHRWVPVLARELPLRVPEPMAQGAPGEGYPFTWSVYRWLDGQSATMDCIRDFNEFATTIAGFLAALQRIDATTGPPAGEHSFYRGAPLEVYDAETRLALGALDGHIDADAATAVWEQALTSTWEGAPVWFHGDVAADNLLIKDGRLAAVIDFGCSGVGDPACDLAIAWTLLSGQSRRVFRTALAVESATWARGRGWALWKALSTLAKHNGDDPLAEATARQVVDTILADFRGTS